MAYLRSKELNDLYKSDRETETFKSGCPLCTSPTLEQFTYWKIIQNKYPYDLISSAHKMLVPLRHVPAQELTAEENAEFMEIKHSEAIQNEYDIFIESTDRARSIPAHFHLHLIIFKHT